MNPLHFLVPLWVVHFAVAAVWFYEGLWCKLLNGEPNQVKVIEAVPGYGRTLGNQLLKLLGIVEIAIGTWVLLNFWPVLCAVVQTALLVGLNSCGLIWARDLIHDPAGMVVKNFAFLVLVWVSASFPTWS